MNVGDRPLKEAGYLFSRRLPGRDVYVEQSGEVKIVKPPCSSESFFDILAGIPQIVDGPISPGVVEPAEGAGAITEQEWMLLQQEQGCWSVGTCPSYNVIGSDVEVVVHGTRGRPVEDFIPTGYQPPAEFRVFGDAKPAVERTGSQDGLASDAQIARNEIGAALMKALLHADLREREWALA